MEQFKRALEHLTYAQKWFLVILVPMTLIAPVFYNYWDSFAKERTMERPDYDNASWEDFILLLVFVPLIHIAKYILKLWSHNYFERNLITKYTGEVLELKIAKSVKNFFKVFFFSFTTVLGYYVLSDTNFHSSLMFGSGDILFLNSDWPYNRKPHYLKLYYMIGLSYHVEDTLVHFFHPAQNDFWEMLLHHYITIMLIVGSYMTAQWNWGIMVMIQMDNGDAIGGMIKAFVDFMPIPFVLTWFIGVVSSWIYFRDFVFAYEIFGFGAMMGRWYSGSRPAPIFQFNCLLVGLWILNLYWTFLFFRMGLRFITKGEVKDLQNPIEDLSEKKALKNLN